MEDFPVEMDTDEPRSLEAANASPTSQSQVSGDSSAPQSQGSSNVSTPEPAPTQSTYPHRDDRTFILKKEAKMITVYVGKDAKIHDVPNAHRISKPDDVKWRNWWKDWWQVSAQSHRCVRKSYR